MAGERYAQITIQAALSHEDSIRGAQTQQVSFRLGAQTYTFQRGGNTGQFIVPDPDDSGVGEDYVLQAVQNILNLLGPRLLFQGAPYVASPPRVIGTKPEKDATARPTPIPVVEFDIMATSYGNDKTLDFTGSYPYDQGFVVTKGVTNVSPVFATFEVTDATAFGATDGALTVTATGGDTPFFIYAWSDGIFGPVRENLAAGTYGCTITGNGGVGATTTIRCLVKSDPRFEVQVATTTDSITLTPSGGLPPYAYEWADGPTTAERQSLVASTYVCVVTDARGVSRRIEVTLSAYHYFWSQNPITLPLDAGDDYRADPTTKPNLSFLCEVWLEKQYLSGQFEQVGTTLEQPADRDGRTTFEVQALLAAFLQYHVPAVGSTGVERADPLFRRFYLRHAEQYGDVPERADTLSLERNYVVLGGLNFYEARQATWFTNFQRTQLPFLTWEPAVKHVLDDQPEYLYYMVTGDPGEFQVQVRIRLDDGTEEQIVTVTQAEVQDFEVYCLPVGYQGLDLASYGGAVLRVLWWEVYVSRLDGTPLSETRRFVRDTRTFPYRRYFLFGTSLGGMATYAALGEAQTDTEVTGEESSLTLAPGYDVLLGDTAVQARALRPVLKVASGPRTRAQLLASQDFLLSRRVLLREGARWLPGFVKAKTGNLLDESKLVLTQEFDFYLTTERLYTPAL